MVRLAEQAVRRLRGRKTPIHVDLATGGGTVALAVANEGPNADVWGSDVSSEAVRMLSRSRNVAAVRRSASLSTRPNRPRNAPMRGNVMFAVTLWGTAKGTPSSGISSTVHVAR